MDLLWKVEVSTTGSGSTEVVFKKSSVVMVIQMVNSLYHLSEQCLLV